MTAESYIYHVTLQTGHARRSVRSEVSAEAIAVCRELIMSIPEGATVPVPACPGYSVSGRVEGHCAAFSVWADGPPSELLLSFAVAGRERCGAAVWRALHDVSNLPPATDRERQPKAPWLAVALEPGIAGHVAAMEWGGDFERCMAWALVDET